MLYMYFCEFTALQMLMERKEWKTFLTLPCLGVITFLTENYTSTRLINQLIDVY